MEAGALLNPTRWTILESLAKGDAAPSEIAATTRSSLPNISQQVKLLEAYGLVKAKREERSGVGKPKLRYRLNKQLAFVAFLREGYAGQKTLSIDPFHAMVLNIWFWDRAEDHYYLQKYCWKMEELLEECLGIGAFDTNEKEIHLLVIAPSEKLEKLRKNFSKTPVKSHDKSSKEIICWTHSPEELSEGLAKKDEYFRNLTRKVHVIFDKEDIFRKVLP